MKTGIDLRILLSNYATKRGPCPYVSELVNSLIFLLTPEIYVLLCYVSSACLNSDGCMFSSYMKDSLGLSHSHLVKLDEFNITCNKISQNVLYFIIVANWTFWCWPKIQFLYEGKITTCVSQEKVGHKLGGVQDWRDKKELTTPGGEAFWLADVSKVVDITRSSKKKQYSMTSEKRSHTIWWLVSQAAKETEGAKSLFVSFLFPLVSFLSIVFL